MNFNEKLRQSAKETGSIVCMGLDPVMAYIPEIYPRAKFRIPAFFEKIFQEMKDQDVLPGAFKPNQGFYIVHDLPRRQMFDGSIALASVMDMLEDMFPGIPVILDYKRGDIAKSSANYAAEGFEAWKADAVTVAPYMGTDSVMPFAEYCNDEQGKGVYVLNRTSNPGAVDFQRLQTGDGSLNMAVAKKIRDWAEENPGIGAVVGATSPAELEELAFIYTNRDHEIPLLIPGVGGQGGKVDEVVDKLKKTNYPLELARINSSSGLSHPWAKKKQTAPDDFANVCVEKLYHLNEKIDYKST